MTWIIDRRETVCPECGTEFTSVASHWTGSECEPVPIPEDVHETIRGMFLGDGHLVARKDLTPHLACKTTRRRHIAWLCDQLDWLARGVAEHEAAYELRTMAHPGLGRYLTWQDGPRADTGWSLSQQAARVWWASSGSLHWTVADRASVQFRSEDIDRVDVYAELLSNAGFTPSVQSGGHVMLPVAETDQWLSWVGPAPPGSAHKYETDRDRYVQLRGRSGRRGPLPETGTTGTSDSLDVADAKTSRYREVLEDVRERVDGDLTRERFDAHAEDVAAEDVADWLGGGSWESALWVADVEAVVVENPGPKKWTQEDCVDAVRTFINETGSKKIVEYDAWAADRDVPASVTIGRYCGGWTDAVEQAGYEPLRSHQ